MNSTGMANDRIHLVHWNHDRTRQAFQLALLGATDKQMAEVMDVSLMTFDYWKRTKQDFREALKAGKTEANAKVAEALYKRATGFWQTETHITNYKGNIIKTKYEKYYPPDVLAATKWLTIRERSIWADIQRTEIMQTNINIMKIDLSGLTTEELMLAKKIGLTQLTENASANQN